MIIIHVFIQLGLKIKSNFLNFSINSIPDIITASKLLITFNMATHGTSFHKMATYDILSHTVENDCNVSIVTM